jgi:hypothetical protein
VQQQLPRLAYVSSDVVCLVSREPFYNKRWILRALELATRANTGVEGVLAPALLMLANKIPGQECELDIELSTRSFFEVWGDDADRLNQYFSSVVCVYLPHAKAFHVDDHGNIISGAEVYAGQLAKVRRIVGLLASGRSQQLGPGASPGSGLLFLSVPLFLRELNAGRDVNVARVIDEAWTAALAAVSESAESDRFVRRGRVFVHSVPSQYVAPRCCCWCGTCCGALDPRNEGPSFGCGCTRLVCPAGPWRSQPLDLSPSPAVRSSSSFSFSFSCPAPCGFCVCAASDVMQSFVAALKPPRALSHGAPAGQFSSDVLHRFDWYRRLVLVISTRILACRLRRLGSVAEYKARAYAQHCIDGVLIALGEHTPCVQVCGVLPLSPSYCGLCSVSGMPSVFGPLAALYFVCFLLRRAIRSTTMVTAWPWSGLTSTCCAFRCA